MAAVSAEWGRAAARRAGAVVACVLVVAATPGGAQTVRGLMVERENATPIEAGFVVLLGPDGKELARALTDLNGRFTLRAPAPGTYRLRSERIGYRLTLSPPVQLEAGPALEYRLDVESIPIQLEAIRVTGENKCRTRLEEGMSSATVWQEARKALTAVSWSQSQRDFRMRLRTYERELEPDLRVRTEQTRSAFGTARRPFYSPPPATLAAQGYLKADSGRGYTFYGPDADVLFSDEFVSGHCFRITNGPNDSAGLVGLGFQPVGRREHVDIEGVMWVDEKSAELRYVDYRYTNMTWGVKSPHVGGRVEFQRLPNGAWVVRRYYIRMPLVSSESEQRIDNLARIATEAPFAVSQRVVLSGFKEDGGEVTDMFAPDGQRLVAPEDATLVGAVTDSLGRPLSGTRVGLLGTNYSVVTSDDGRYQLTGILEGSYIVSFVPLALRGFGYLPSGPTVLLPRGATVTTDLQLPGHRRLFRQLCPDDKADPPTAAITGLVRDSLSGQPIPRARVRVSWSNWELRGAGSETRTSTQFAGTRTGLEAIADSAGYYWACGVPANELVEVVGLVEENAGLPTELRTKPFQILSQSVAVKRP